MRGNCWLHPTASDQNFGGKIVRHDLIEVHDHSVRTLTTISVLPLPRHLVHKNDLYPIASFPLVVVINKGHDVSVVAVDIVTRGRVAPFSNTHVVSGAVASPIIYSGPSVAIVSVSRV